MVTSAKSGFGVSLTRNGNVIAEITKLTAPKVKQETIDVTSHDSTSGFREFIGSLKDAGDISIQGSFIPGDTDGQVGLYGDLVAGTAQAFVLTAPTAAFTFSVTFTGLVTEFSHGDYNIDGKVEFSATIKVTGVPTFAIGASNNITALALQCASGVISPSPNFDGAVYEYGLAPITTDAYVMVTVTDATALTITAEALGVTWPLTTAVQSGHILIGAADTITDLTITVTDTGKVSKVYTVHIVRPSA